MLLERRYDADKKQIKEMIFLDPSGRIAALLEGRDRLELFYDHTKDGKRIDLQSEEILIQGMGVKTSLGDGTVVPSYALHTPTLMEALVEKESVSREGKVAWFFDIEDLEKLFREADLSILRTASLGNLHKLVYGMSPDVVPNMLLDERFLEAMKLAEFARQNTDKIAAIEKALYRDLKTRTAYTYSSPPVRLGKPLTCPRWLLLLGRFCGWIDMMGLWGSLFAGLPSTTTPITAGSWTMGGTLTVW